MSNTDLSYSHKAELLHSLLVAVVTVLPWQQGYLLIRITFVANMKLNYFYSVQLLHNPWVAMVTVFPYQQGKPVIATLLKKVGICQT